MLSGTACGTASVEYTSGISILLLDYPSVWKCCLVTWKVVFWSVAQLAPMMACKSPGISRQVYMGRNDEMLNLLLIQYISVYVVSISEHCWKL